MKTVSVKASGEYEVAIGAGLLDRVGDCAGSLGLCGRALLVSGRDVFPLYGEKVQKSLENAGFSVLSFVHGGGESAKSPENCLALLKLLCENHFSRSDTVFALGGGVTGDLAGFAAAIYRRGMNFVQLPTTLLAAVDASVGGKTAIDLPSGKNQVGAFYQPRAVLCDTEALKTLPAAEVRCGCAEIIKCGVLSGEELFAALENAERLDTEEIIEKCVALKRDIVEADEFDKGERRLLNLGHTVGHAVELCSGYRVPHGEAVAIGLARIARKAVQKGRLPADDCERILSLLKKFGLPTDCDYTAAELFAAAANDKKISGGKLALIVPEGIGCCRVIPMEPEEFKSWID